MKKLIEYFLIPAFAFSHFFMISIACISDMKFIKKFEYQVLDDNSKRFYFKLNNKYGNKIELSYIDKNNKLYKYTYKLFNGNTMFAEEKQTDKKMIMLAEINSTKLISFVITDSVKRLTIKSKVTDKKFTKYYGGKYGKKFI